MYHLISSQPDLPESF